MMNQMGANIQYPYHELPLISTDDRLGFWAMLGIYEDLTDEIYGTDDVDKKNRIEIECEGKREDEK